jgi:hypothetical protein
MPLNLASPGIVVREVDLTVGRVDPTSDRIGAIVAPFAQGPVELPTIVQNENELLNIFGKPYSANKHYESWLTASSYLAYGGSLRVVRADDIQLKNAKVGTGDTPRVKSVEHYEQLGYDESALTNVTVFSKDPGSWGNGLRVGIIDGKGDQILGINTNEVTVRSFNAVVTDRVAVIVGVTTDRINNYNTDDIEAGQDIEEILGVIGSGTTVVSVTGAGAGHTVFINPPTTNVTQPLSSIQLSFGSYTTTTTTAALEVGYGVTQSVVGRVSIGAGTTTELDGYLKGVVTEVGSGTASVKVLSHVSAAGTETVTDYTPGGIYEFKTTSTVAIHTNGQPVSYGSTEVTSSIDWFNSQTLVSGQSVVGGATTLSTINWSEIADRPTTTTYGSARGARNDEVHVVVIDAEGKITGNAGTILEKHLGLSKAKDAEFSAGSPSYWRKYLKDNSSYIFAGDQPAGVTTIGYSSEFDLVSNSNWDVNASGVTFGAVGAFNGHLSGGRDYEGETSIGSTVGLGASLVGLSAGYELLSNNDTYAVDFLLMGSAGYDKEDAQALAQKVISVADVRKDSIAFISPHRGAAITDSSNDTEVQIKSDADITDNVLSFYAPLSSSSYAVFDSGYKYMYDRFNGVFRYVPLNGDIAGTCARTDANAFPWFSPAGTERGSILNAVKLAYNPSKAQRDRLYSARINPVIVSPGGGIVLFGDKTGLSKSSAFDRINVRRLFIYLENAVEAAARDQLFEFNDEITRTNFVNIVEPFLRDVQAKRGIQDYVVICDETNNTAAVIDNNEFVADIYIKPARSINFIGLTFVATRTGVSFEEVVGNV